MAQGSIAYTEGSGSNVGTHTVTRAGETQEIEVIAPGAGVLATWDWDTEVTTLTSVGDASISVDTQGAGRIVVGMRSSSAAVAESANFMLMFYAADDGLICPSAAVAPVVTAYSDGTYYYLTVCAFANDVGAASVGLFLSALPASATSVDIIVKAL